MEVYYLFFNEKRYIHVEARYEVDYFKNDFPDIHYQIGVCDWVPFTIPVDPYFPEKVEDKGNQFQWVAKIIAIGQPQWAISRGLIHQRDLKFEAFMWLDLPLENIVRADDVITLATKTDKDALTMKCIKGTEHRTLPPPSTPYNTPASQFHPATAPTTTPPDLVKLEQMAQVHESQLIKLAKAIPYMIQQAIKKAMQPARDKLKGLYTAVEVLENEVITLGKEVATLIGPPSACNPTPLELAVVPS
ncbi:hypothetical protein HAX54_039059 [Datura stramonium]|uniref:Uncharacterized protein n=1 Tax=Datura stramonium TaxID=4076 RepID=A0ABS8SJ08_DATST|nr:hypothetical protein [Datura stramonium]